MSRSKRRTPIFGITTAKSEKEIDRGFDTFTKVYKLDREEGFVTSVEKSQLRENNSKAASSLDDCVEEEI